MNRILFTFILSLVLCGSLSGCVLADLHTAFEVDHAIEEYNAKAPEVKLGNNKNEVLAILQPTQGKLPVRFRKPMETFTDTSAGKTRIVEIHFFRSAHIPDNRMTDDEFTPYIFHDDTLVAIGWTALGGPKIISSPQSQSNVIINQNPIPPPQPKTHFTCFQNGPFVNCH